MRLPLSWLKEFVPITMSAEKLADALTLAGHEVEKIHRVTNEFDHIVVGRINKITPHPNADKLRLVETLIDRTKSVSIVCGGSNIVEGMLVAVALPGAQVRWHGQGELVELKITGIRGAKSHGMICAASEIGLFDLFPHAEREILDLTFTGVAPGTSIAKALGMDETLFTLDITPNRGDCMSVVGIAREIAAITNVKFKIPKATLKTPAQQKKLDIQIKDGNLCPFYGATVIDGVKVGPSPAWIQNRLRAVGIRSINNIVDATNYVMMEMGQPLHAFDAAKVRSIVVRRAKKEESIQALDGNKYVLEGGMLMIADENRPIAIAGVMGGEDSGVSECTTSIVLESAIFDPISVSRTYRRLNLRSESSIRFERGIDSDMTRVAAARAAELITTIAGGKVVAYVGSAKGKFQNTKLKTTVQKINAVLGVLLKPKEITDILKRLGFLVSGSGALTITAPSWRHDIAIEEDIIEEVGRIYGYNRMTPTLPRGELHPSRATSSWVVAKAVKQGMVRAGFDEVLTYSFYDARAAGTTPHFEIENPLNREERYIRAALLPNLLRVASWNARIVDAVHIFEIGQVTAVHKGKPEESMNIAGVATSKGRDATSLYREVKGVLQYALGQEVAVRVLTGSEQEEYKFRNPGVCFELSLNPSRVTERVHIFRPLSEYPAVKRDCAIMVEESVNWDRIAALLRREGGGILKEVELFDRFTGGDILEGKVSYAFHLTFELPDRTLTSEEVEQVMERMVKALTKEVGAHVRV